MSKLLIIDDEPLQRWAMHKYLQACGHTVLEADRAGEGLALAATTAGLDLILLDLRLPDMDGAMLLERLARELPAVRLLVLSSHVTEDVTADLLARGADAVQRKPCDLELLATLVADVLAGRSGNGRGDGSDGSC